MYTKNSMIKVVTFVRALLLLALLPLFTLMCSFLVILIIVAKAPKSFVHWFMHDFWSRNLLRSSGVKVILENQENVPKEDGFLYLFTHSSLFDIPALFTHSPRDFRFGAKSELFKIPFFGKAMTITGTLPIARGDRDKVIEVYRNAEKRVANGEAFALAPEGGRRKTKEIAPFKSGPLIFAINCNMPLVPVVICGADKVLGNRSVLINYGQWQSTVGIRFLPPIETKGFRPEDAKILKEKIRNDVVANYQDMLNSGKY